MRTWTSLTLSYENRKHACAGNINQVLDSDDGALVFAITRDESQKAFLNV
jgi:hypothetical protein